jgi:hypothetical protein
VLLNSLLLSTVAWAAPNLSLLGDGSHCVAYKAEKIMFLFVNSDPVVGKNCDISAQVLPEVGGLYHIEVIIPISGFQSGDPGRDEDVGQTLRSGVKPEMLFRTKARTPEEWRTLFAKAAFDLEGELSIGDKFYPLKVASKYVQRDETPEIDGIAKVKFSDFDISPPKVIGGVVAKTKPEFELHFHLLGSRILGADSIRLENAIVKEKDKK